MTIAQGMLMGILLLASLQDHDEMYLPNRVPAFAFVLGVFSLFTGIGVTPWDGLLGSLAGGFLFFVFAWLGAKFFGKVSLGGADIKMMFAIGLFLGWKVTLLAAFLAYLAGSIIGVYGMMSKSLNRKSHIPFMPALLAGSWVSIFYGDTLIKAYQTFL